MKSLTSRTKGIICIIFAAFGFSLMSMFVRLSGPDIPVFEKAFFRNTVALIVASVAMLRQKIPVFPKKQNALPLLGRCFFGTIGLVSNFYAVDNLVLADANVLNKLSPFFAIIFSIILLKERPNIIQLIGVIAAFAGSIFIIKPGFENTSLVPALFGVLGGLGAGIAYTFVRKLGASGENSSRIVFSFSAFSCITCIPFMLFNFVPLKPVQLLYLILAGFCACIGQFGITKAYLYAPAKEISVYDYSQVIFAAIIGYIMFNQLPDLYSIIGYLLICGAGAGMFFYNKSANKNLSDSSAAGGEKTRRKTRRTSETSEDDPVC